MVYEGRMLVEMAIGDGYGAAFEFVKPPYKSLIHDCRTYQQHPELLIGNGRYTDDTQMTLAVAETLVRAPTEINRSLFHLSKFDFADSFVTGFKRDVRPGYGKRTFAALQAAENGAQLIELAEPSTRSGGAMRAAPVGLLPDLSMVLLVSENQASVTHDTTEGIGAAKAVALMAHYLAYGLGPRENIGNFVGSFVSLCQWQTEWSGWISVEGLDCAHAVMTVVRQATSYTDVLRRSVDFGGDVDTVAAVAMALASLTDLENDLSSTLYDGLENGPYGRDYLAEVDSKLLSLM
jgi:ADP-ribosyl-[dinitrogen reductase] hydrolase